MRKIKKRIAELERQLTVQQHNSNQCVNPQIIFCGFENFNPDDLLQKLLQSIL